MSIRLFIIIIIISTQLQISYYYICANIMKIGLVE